MKAQTRPFPSRRRASDHLLWVAALASIWSLIDYPVGLGLFVTLVITHWAYGLKQAAGQRKARMSYVPSNSARPGQGRLYSTREVDRWTYCFGLGSRSREARN
jgi:hypothetical protein